MTFQELRSLYGELNFKFDSKLINREEFITQLENIDFSKVENNSNLGMFEVIIKDKIESLKT